MDQMPGRFPPPPDANQPQWGDRPQQSLYPLDMGRLWSLTVSIFRFRWKMFVGMSLLIMAPAWLLVAAVDLVANDTTTLYEEMSEIARDGGSVDVLLPRLWQSLALELIVGAIAGIALYLANGAVTRGAADVFSGAPATASRSLRQTFARIPSFVGMWLIAFLVTFAIIAVGVVAGTLLIIATAAGGRVLPGPSVFFGLIVFVATFVAVMFVSLRFAMAVPAIVLEDSAAVASLRRSWRIVAGSTWRVLGYTLLFALVLGLIGALLGLVLILLINPYRMVGATIVSVDPVRFAMSTFATGLISAGLMPITSIGMMLLYFDLRSRKGEKAPLPGDARSTAAQANPGDGAESVAEEEREPGL
jgi:hypothetical protein